jgi:hypothetical protein
MHNVRLLIELGLTDSSMRGTLRGQEASTTMGATKPFKVPTRATHPSDYRTNRTPRSTRGTPTMPPACRRTHRPGSKPSPRLQNPSWLAVSHHHCNQRTLEVHRSACNCSVDSVRIGRLYTVEGVAGLLPPEALGSNLEGVLAEARVGQDALQLGLHHRLPPLVVKPPR